MGWPGFYYAASDVARPASRAAPIEAGDGPAAVVRDGATLRDAFSLVPPYLRTEEGRGFGGLPWYSEYGIQQTRGFGR